MTRLFGILCVATVLGWSGSAWAKGGTIETVPQSLLVGRAEVNELHAFPEMAATAEGRASAAMSSALSSHAVDSVYQSPLPYDQTVRFFDDQFTRRHLRVVARTTTETSTAWTVRRQDSTVANVIVRTTTPHITFEIAEAAFLG